MELLEKVLDDKNLLKACDQVYKNKGASGVDKMSVNQIETYFYEHKDEIIEAIMNKTYNPQPVRRLYIPKADGKLRPLGYLQLLTV